MSLGIYLWLYELSSCCQIWGLLLLLLWLLLLPPVCSAETCPFVAVLAATGLRYSSWFLDPASLGGPTLQSGLKLKIHVTCSLSQTHGDMAGVASFLRDCCAASPTCRINAARARSLARPLSLSLSISLSLSLSLNLSLSLSLSLNLSLSLSPLFCVSLSLSLSLSLPPQDLGPKLFPHQENKVWAAPLKSKASTARALRALSYLLTDLFIYLHKGMHVHTQRIMHIRSCHPPLPQAHAHIHNLFLLFLFFCFFSLSLSFNISLSLHLTHSLSLSISLSLTLSLFLPHSLHTCACLWHHQYMHTFWQICNLIFHTHAQVQLTYTSNNCIHWERERALIWSRFLVP